MKKLLDLMEENYDRIETLDENGVIDRKYNLGMYFARICLDSQEQESGEGRIAVYYKNNGKLAEAYDYNKDSAEFVEQSLRDKMQLQN